MNFDIKNIVVVLAIVLSSCASTRKGQVAAPKQSQLPVSSSGGVLVFQDGKSLKAVDMDTGATSVLRDSFLQGRFPDNNGGWRLSPDGASLAFTATPEDIEFFSVAAYRDYLFTAPFNGRQQVLLAAYGLHRPKRPYSFRAPSYSADSKRIVVSQAETGDYPEPSEIAIYDIKTRREIWSSRELPVSRLFKPRPYSYASLFSPSLSPDGNDVVCFAQEMPSDGTAPEIWAESRQKAPPIRLVHFDLKRKSAEVLAVIEDQLSVGRRHMTDKQNSDVEPGVRQLKPHFAWHPTQKKFIFVGPSAPEHRANNLFSFDLRTHKMARFSDGDHDDCWPQWSLDGKSVVWLRDYLIFRADADGSKPTHILTQIAGMTQIQLLPQIADWGRYRKLSIKALAGKDK